MFVLVKIKTSSRALFAPLSLKPGRSSSYHKVLHRLRLLPSSVEPLSFAGWEAKIVANIEKLDSDGQQARDLLFDSLVKELVVYKETSGTAKEYVLAEVISNDNEAQLCLLRFERAKVRHRQSLESPSAQTPSVSASSCSEGQRALPTIVEIPGQSNHVHQSAHRASASSGNMDAFSTPSGSSSLTRHGSVSRKVVVARDTVVNSRVKLTDKLLKHVKFSPTERPHLIDLFIAMEAVHNHEVVLQHQSHWFANTFSSLLQILFPGHTCGISSAGRKEGYKHITHAYERPKEKLDDLDSLGADFMVRKERLLLKLQSFNDASDRIREARNARGASAISIPSLEQVTSDALRKAHEQFRQSESQRILAERERYESETGRIRAELECIKAEQKLVEAEESNRILRRQLNDLEMKTRGLAINLHGN